MYGIKLTLLIAALIAGVVVYGNIRFDKKNGDPINWKRTLISAGVAAFLTILIGLVTE